MRHFFHFNLRKKKPIRILVDFSMNERIKKGRLHMFRDITFVKIAIE